MDLLQVNREMECMVGDGDDKLKAYLNEITEPVVCIILGRKLAQKFNPHWTAAFNNTNGAEEGSKKIIETYKILFTKTLTESDWDNTYRSKRPHR